jgi:hypothetical protein
VRDRVVIATTKIVLEPVFEADFAPSSFGFRPKRSASRETGGTEPVRPTGHAKPAAYLTVLRDREALVRSAPSGWNHPEGKKRVPPGRDATPAKKVDPDSGRAPCPFPRGNGLA